MVYYSELREHGFGCFGGMDLFESAQHQLGQRGRAKPLKPQSNVNFEDFIDFGDEGPQNSSKNGSREHGFGFRVPGFGCRRYPARKTEIGTEHAPMKSSCPTSSSIACQGIHLVY